MDKTSVGIIIPDSAKEKPFEGVVEAIGDIVGDIKVGDKVLYGKYVGTEVKVGGESLLLLREDDVIAVMG